MRRLSVPLAPDQRSRPPLCRVCCTPGFCAQALFVTFGRPNSELGGILAEHHFIAPLMTPHARRDLLGDPNVDTICRTDLSDDEIGQLERALSVSKGEFQALNVLLEVFEEPLEGYQLNTNVDVLEKLPGALAIDSDAERELGPKGGATFLELWALRSNPALSRFAALHGDPALERRDGFEAASARARDFLASAPPYGPEPKHLMDLLQAPAEAAPNSLMAQLDYVVQHWAGLAPNAIASRLLRAQDSLREETPRGAPGPPEMQLPEYEYDGTAAAEDCFTPDQSWMPEVVVVAKNVFVWLDQLSKRFERQVATLDQIPDEVLDELSERGFTGLWLIGVWERSQASRRIKQRMGNPEAMASAYAIFDHVVSEELGGEEALLSLKARAAERGIRLAADMVPNHTGIDSRWVVEHPERFVTVDRPPYDNYRFDGPDLCEDPRASVHIEDGYWNHSDAAVVFKRYDHQSGATQFIYHGNDGTHMPWNDTAQLDFRRDDVRRAIIETIVDVARRFPIIRFDAAMTLTRDNFQRLWFPPPGSGGAIPSRSIHGISESEFFDKMPVEFWRQVVDEIAARAPDTLLLAEAFWLTESYFVRTLGMHRVYNSAFMNMVKAEENGKYRQYIKDILLFNPEIMRRYVNFMSNPDEDTAIAQFGTHDKYFGVATMMVTMPGLPMFAHGQVEGFTEKYGMEYRRAYRDEAINDGLVDRHRYDIFPLMSRRALFSGVEHFALFDFERPDGSVDENVFAYTNRHGAHKAVILVNNTLESTKGRIRWSVPTRDDPDGICLVEALGFEPGETQRFGELRRGREWMIDTSQLESGLELELDGYEAVVLLHEP